MTDLYQIVQNFFTVPGFPFELGLMVSTALILGFLLYSDWVGIAKWAITVVVFLFFLEWLRSSIIDFSGINHSNTPIALDAFGSILFMLSASSGAYLAYRHNRRIEEISAGAERVMNLIRERKIDQITKPLDQNNQTGSAQ